MINLPPNATTYGVNMDMIRDALAGQAAPIESRISEKEFQAEILRVKERLDELNARGQRVEGKIDQLLGIPLRRRTN